ncbi:MAG: LysR family transcriptional regulator [Myxococcales bacterium]|nr:LysR family transcriptional regulator [Myxococcales bacterium]
MIDGISLDQLRTFLAAVDEGSFSAAGRRLQRAQSVVSQTLANLEGRLGVVLFDRGARLPVLTVEGRALVEMARAVLGTVDGFQARAVELAGGFEPELAIAVDQFFPRDQLTDALAALHATFPETTLRIYSEAMGGPFQYLFDDRCSLAITGSLPTVPPEFSHERFGGVEMIFVVSSRHPLGTMKGPVPEAELRKHVQIVVSDRSKITEGRDFGVIAAHVWKVSDLEIKIACVRAGLGWGAVPLAMVQAELAAGTIVPVEMDGITPTRGTMPMYVVHRIGSPPGRAGRWLIEYLKNANGRR